MNENSIGNIIKSRRKYLQVTQKDLAEIVGVGLRGLIDIENGNGNPTLETLSKICDALGLEVKVEVRDGKANEG